MLLPGRMTVRVAARRTEALDICSFELVAQDGRDLPAFEAGAHVDVHLPGGLTRQYSLCNAPSERHRYVLGVLRDPVSRGGSRALHEALSEGGLLEISAPKNRFPLAPGARRSLLLAGGIGITPLLAMAEHLAAGGDDFELHYCTRSRDRTAFRGRLEGAGFANRVVFHFDDGDASQRLDAAGLLARPEPGTHLYVCGPGGFMNHVLGVAAGAGWPAGSMHHEFFAAEVAVFDSDGPFDLLLARSQRVVCVAKGQTALEALAAAGVDVDSSCEQGICGSCLTPVLEGTPDHRDSFMVAAEHARNDRFTPCCSRARSARLVLDL